MLTTAQTRSSREARSEQLVAICPEVLSEAEHALGNLFQRIHHIARMARDGLGPNAERMTGALSDLQELLDLVFEYVTPPTLDARPLGCDRIVESLAANIRPVAGQSLQLEPAPSAKLVVDARALTRSFQLVARAHARELGAARSISVRAMPGTAGATIDLAIQLAGERGVSPAAQIDLAWEVAARLVELQGGELRHVASDAVSTIAFTFPVGG